jgi:predicted dehydrogenase
MARAIREGRIGELRHVEGSYLQSWLSSRLWGDWRRHPALLWRLSTRHGSKGVLGDLGVHLVDFATFPAGPISSVACRLRAFPKAPRNRVGPYVLDANDSAVLSVAFANGALGILHTSRWAAGSSNRLALRISGTLGAVEMDSDRSTDSFRICSGPGLHKDAWREVKAPPVRTNYHRFITAVLGGRPFEPDFARGAEIQAVLDACFESDRRGRPVDVKGT